MHPGVDFGTVAVEGRRALPAGRPFSRKSTPGSSMASTATPTPYTVSVGMTTASPAARASAASSTVKNFTMESPRILRRWPRPRAGRPQRRS
jgi:hypothetical protein